MEQMRERVKAAVVSYAFQECQPDKGDIFGWFDDRADEIADAALSLMQPEIDRRVAEEKADLESKFRCVVSHATAGNLQDIDVSLNEISVRISQFRTKLWEQAKQIGAKEEKAKLLERLRNMPNEVADGIAKKHFVSFEVAKLIGRDIATAFQQENSDAD